MLTRRSHGLVTLLVLLDAILAAGAFLGAFGLRFYTPILGAAEWPVPVDQYLIAVPAVVITTLLGCWLADLYRPGAALPITASRPAVTRGAAFAVLLVLALAAFYRETTYSRWVLALYFPLLLVSLPLSRLLARWVMTWWYGRSGRRQPVLILGEGEVARRLIESLRAYPWTGIGVAGTVSASADAAVTGDLAASLGSLKELERILAERAYADVYVALSLEQMGEVADLEDKLRSTSADVHVVFDVGGLLQIRPQASMLAGLPVFTVRGRPGYGWHRFAKRALDVIVSAVALVLFLPLMGLVALAVRISSGSPVLYRQTRVGWGGAPFEMLKFRTMRRDAEADGPQLATRGDPRRTALGRLLRKTSLDELPQLVNVLRGEMSLVGPRPERPELLPDLQQHLPHYPLRLSVKAGMTGWAQVHGYRGDTPFEDRLTYDLDYVRNWSLILDLHILLRTAFGGFLNSAA